MTPATAGKVKFGVWGLICGAVIAMILGFAWGGWTTRSTTQQMGEAAVLAAEKSPLGNASNRLGAAEI